MSDELPAFKCGAQPPDGAQHVHSQWAIEYRRRFVDPATARPGLEQEWNGNVFQLVAPNVAASPKKVCMTWLDERGGEVLKLTFGEIERRAAAVARLLQKQGVKRGECVVVCFPPGLEFVPAFLGCLQIGAVAVPVYPPNPTKLSRDLVKFRLVAEDCSARVVLTCRKFYWVMKVSSMKHPWPKGLSWHATDSLKTPKGRHWNELRFAACAERLRGDDLAFLQYTSGSTGRPKGVMIGHGNLHHNMLAGAGRILASVLPEREEARILTWVPQYHDLGLMSTYLGALVDGGQAIAMSPMSFLRDPVLWMRMLSRYKCTHTTAPNFSYELVMRKFDPKRLPPGERLDLSTMRWIGNAAEPVRADTIERFQRTFAAYGLRPNVFRPMFGMAESVVYVTDAAGVSTFPDPDGHPRVGCGEPCLRLGVDVRIVSPDTFEEVPLGEVGEIWIRSPSVAHGYYNRPEQTAETFGGVLRNAAEDDPQRGKTFLRSGDLAQMIDGHLVYGGRIKDLIIVCGRNYHPHDVEMAVQGASDLVRPGCVASFSLESADAARAAVGGADPDGSEELVAVAELRTELLDAEYKAHPNLTREAILDRVGPAVRGEIQMAVGLSLRALVLIEPRSIPKTTSGKIRRRATKDALLEGKLKEIRRWVWQDAGAAGGAGNKKILRDASVGGLSEIGRQLAAEAGGAGGAAGASLATRQSLNSLASSDSMAAVAARGGLGGGGGDDESKHDALEAPPQHRRRKSRALMQEYGVEDDTKTLTENGLDSLHLTQFLQQVREQTGVELEMRDVMELNVHDLLRVIGSEQTGLHSDEPPTKHTALSEKVEGRPVGDWLRHVLQTIGVLLVLVLPALSTIPAYHWVNYVTEQYGVPWSRVTLGHGPSDAEMARDETKSLTRVHMFGLMAIACVPLWSVVYTAALVATKWLVVGRYRPGSFALHSPAYLRWWFVDRCVAFWEFFVGRFLLGTKLANLVYKLMGARVAWNASVNTFLREADLVTLAPGSTLSGRVYPRLVTPQLMWMDAILVGAGSTVDTGCVVLPGAELRDGVELLPNTVVLQGSVLVAQPDYTWQGNPCRRVRRDGSRAAYVPPGGLPAGHPNAAPAPAPGAAAPAAVEMAAPAPHLAARPSVRKLSVLVESGAENAGGGPESPRSPGSRSDAPLRAAGAEPSSPGPVRTESLPRASSASPGAGGAAPLRTFSLPREGSPKAAPSRQASLAGKKLGAAHVHAHAKPARVESLSMGIALPAPVAETKPVAWGLEASKVLSLGLLFVVVNACGVPVRLAWYHLGLPDFRYTLVLYFTSVYFCTLAVFALFTVASKWALFGRVRPGVYLDTSLCKWRRWWMSMLSRVSFSFTLLFDYSRFNVLWLRAMGVRKVYNSPILNPTGGIPAYDADLVEVESDTVFISSVAIRCDRSVGNGYRRRAPVRLGANTWVGLASVVEGGVTLRNRSAVGAASFVPEGTEIDSGSVAFGNPYILERGVSLDDDDGGAAATDVESGAPEAGAAPRKQSLFGELCTSLLCLAQAGAAFACVLPAYELGRLFNTTLGLPVEASLALLAVDAMAVMIALALSALAFKWLLLGRAAEGARPATDLNSPFFVRYTAANRFNYYVRVYVLPLVHGTVWSVLYHRAMGARIGKGALIFTSSVLDHDQLTVEEGAVLDKDCYAICHVLQKQTFFIGPMRVGRQACMQPHAVCFNNDHIEDGATLGSLSKCFPGQAVRSGEHWQGNPAHRRRLLKSVGSFKRQSSALQNFIRQSSTLASLTHAAANLPPTRPRAQTVGAPSGVNRAASIRGMCP